MFSTPPERTVDPGALFLFASKQRDALAVLADRVSA